MNFCLSYPINTLGLLRSSTWHTRPTIQTSLYFCIYWDCNMAPIGKTRYMDRIVTAYRPAWRAIWYKMMYAGRYNYWAWSQWLLVILAGYRLKIHNDERSSFLFGGAGNFLLNDTIWNHTAFLYVNHSSALKVLVVSLYLKCLMIQKTMDWSTCLWSWSWNEQVQTLRMTRDAQNQEIMRLQSCLSRVRTRCWNLDGIIDSPEWFLF